MIIDNYWMFSKQQAIAGGAGVDVIATNVHDAGAAVKLFEGGPGTNPLKIDVDFTAVGGTTPTVRARFVAADNAALTTNPIILADTGVSAAIVAADVPVHRELVPSGQRTAKQFYGVIYTQAGADNTATVNAQGVVDAHSAQLR